MRHLLALLPIAALMVAPAACRKQPEGTVKVVAIGAEPRLRDPADGLLTVPDEVLLENVAQGLVAFDASGNIVPALAERWNVSDDGLSYIFRIASTNWPDGRKVTAQQVARLLKREIAPRSKNPLKDTLGAVGDVVAMTDRVLEIQLIAPRPNLLPLLAQPQFAIIRGNVGTGPFAYSDAGGGQAMRLTREVAAGGDDEQTTREEVSLAGAKAGPAVADFIAGKSDLVLGGRFNDLALAQQAKAPRGTLRFDPASGLFGLIPIRGDIGDADLRRVLSQAIDRDALIAALGVPNLAARATLLEPGLDGLPRARRSRLARHAARRSPPGASGRGQPQVRQDREAGHPHRPARGAGRRSPVGPTCARLGGIGLQGRARGDPGGGRLRADRRGRAVQFRRLVRAPVSLCPRAAVRCRDRPPARLGANRPDPGPALCVAGRGGRPDRRSPAVHPDRRAGALVAGVEAHPGLRGEPLRPSHALRSRAEKRRRRLTILDKKRLPFPVGTDPQSVRQRVEAMEKLLERMFVIPGLNRPVGLDVILDLVPGIGDIAGAALGSYMVWEARNLGMSKWQMTRMAGNVGFDFLLGLIPFVGAIPDFLFRSNTRNLRIIKRHLDKHHAATATVDAPAQRAD